MITAAVWLAASVFMIHTLAGVPLLATFPPALIITAAGWLFTVWVLPADARDRHPRRRPGPHP